jgi:Asp-tRNA(Asn)/Glu-tRNA(Gln) amidotransferase A subunit family amidase
LKILNWIALASGCGLLTNRRLPVGVQIIAPRGGDSGALAVAQWIEE